MRGCPTSVPGPNPQGPGGAHGRWFTARTTPSRRLGRSRTAASALRRWSFRRLLPPGLSCRGRGGLRRRSWADSSRAIRRLGSSRPRQGRRQLSLGRPASRKASESDSSGRRRPPGVAPIHRPFWFLVLGRLLGHEEQELPKPGSSRAAGSRAGPLRELPPYAPCLRARYGPRVLLRSPRASMERSRALDACARDRTGRAGRLRCGGARGRLAPPLVPGGRRAADRLVVRLAGWAAIRLLSVRPRSRLVAAKCRFGSARPNHSRRNRRRRYGVRDARRQ